MCNYVKTFIQCIYLKTYTCNNMGTSYMVYMLHFFHFYPNVIYKKMNTTDACTSKLMTA